MPRHISFLQGTSEDVNGNKKGGRGADEKMGRRKPERNPADNAGQAKGDGAYRKQDTTEAK